MNRILFKCYCIYSGSILFLHIILSVLIPFFSKKEGTWASKANATFFDNVFWAALLLILPLIFYLIYLVISYAFETAIRRELRSFFQQGISPQTASINYGNGDLLLTLNRAVKDMSSKVDGIHLSIQRQSELTAKLSEKDLQVTALSNKNTILINDMARSESECARLRENLLKMQREQQESVNAIKLECENRIHHEREIHQAALKEQELQMAALDAAYKAKIATLGDNHKMETDQIQEFYSKAIERFVPDMAKDDTIIVVTNALSTAIAEGNATPEEILLFGEMQRLAASVNTDDFKLFCIEFGKAYYSLAYSSAKWQKLLIQHQNTTADWLNKYMPAPFKVYSVDVGREYDMKYHLKDGAGIIVKRALSFLIMADTNGNAVYKKAMIET